MGDAVARGCLVCHAPEARLRYRIRRFDVLECRRCAQVYLSPLPDEEEIRALFAQLYTTGEGSVPELRSYYGFCYEDSPSNPLVQLYERWLDALERRCAPGRLLDVGCGTGLFLAVARRRGWEPHGVDECVEATRHARDHFGLDVRVGPFSDVALESAPFDVITMWDIIEHARAPAALLAGARARLRPGGLVGLSTPNQRNILDRVGGALYWITGGRLTAPLEKLYIEQHFLYFTPETLERSLEDAGLELVELRRELTDLRRLTLRAPLRLALTGLFALARLTGLENRLLAIAQPRPAA